MAFGVGCTNSTYNNITCVQSTAVETIGSCGAYATKPSVTSGNRLIIYSDIATGTGNVTSITDSAGNAWTTVPNQGATHWNGATPSSTDSVWTAIANSTATLTITLNCSVSVANEFAITELHSSLGTVGIDCSSTFQVVNSGSNPSTTCTASHSNDMGYSMSDWNNGATQGSGWTLISENAENIQEVRAMSGTTINGTWTLGPDSFISATIGFSDGAAATSQTPTWGRFGDAPNVVRYIFVFGLRRKLWRMREWIYARVGVLDQPLLRRPPMAVTAPGRAGIPTSRHTKSHTVVA